MEVPISQVSDDLRAALDRAQRETAQRHGVYVDVEHLLLGVLEQPSGAAADWLRARGVAPQPLYDRVAGEVGVTRGDPSEVKGWSRAAQAALERAAAEASALHTPRLGTGHLLLSLMAEPGGAVHDALADLPFTADDLRAYIREHAEARAPRSMPAPGPAVRRPAPPAGQPEIVLVPTRRQPKPGAQPAHRPPRALLWIGIGAALLAYAVFALPGSTLGTFAIVLVGWIFSLSLHEFSHALVAYLGGDHTVRDKGYLTFNPLKYTDPLLSIGLPLLFLALGGIGLPGGAVYIERQRLRNKWWGAAVSAAGPAANALLAGLLALPFALGLYQRNSVLWSALAFLALLQVTAVVLNLLPVPPFDGFGILEPLLDLHTRELFRQFGRFGLLLVFALLWFYPPAQQAFWDLVLSVTHFLQIPDGLINEGFWNFMFWRQR